MKKVYLLALIAAVIVGLSAYGFASALKKQATPRYGAVVVAKADIPGRTQLTADMLAVKEIPVEAIHPLSVRSVNEAVGQILQDAMTADQPLLSTMLKKVEGGEGLSYSIPTGMRALTIQVDAISGLENFLQPGDHVDVVATVQLRTSANASATAGTQRQASIVALQNIEVLATGKALQKNAAAEQYTSITLAVSPTDAVRLDYVSNGKIRLMLRGPLDNSTPEVPYFDGYIGKTPY